MFKTKRLRNSEKASAMIIQRDIMPVTGAYNTVKKNISIMDYTSIHVLECISYWLSMSFF